MPRFYENDPLRQQEGPEASPDPRETERSFPTEEVSPASSDLYEEFDISSFDFSIADPGEDSGDPPDATATDEAAPFSPEVSKTDPPTEERGFNPPSPRESQGFPRKLFPKTSQKEVSDQKNTPSSHIPFSLSKDTLRLKGKRYLRYALRPFALYENIGEILWPLFLLGAALFMGGVYLLIGLDWYQAELISAPRLWAFVLVGLLMGSSACLAFAGGAQIVSIMSRKEKLRPFRIISAVAGAATIPSALLILGLLLQLLFGAAVSMSFGILAVLWWIYILTEVLRELFGERFLASLTFLTLWSFLLFAMMSLTFSLK